ncbi:adenylosuccinate lyase [Streptomyces sp. NPDC059477]|uniref:adenylosuccinate lyase n=1 Tax=Streptomyces sp. NPDC059477 TaxID=3346847 RepID=UPI0036D1FB39
MPDQPDPAAAPAHLMDSRILGGLFASDAMRAVFSDRAMVQSWLDAEAALAGAQADLGVVPRAAAERIAECAVAERFDLEVIGAEIERTAHPLVPLVRRLAEAAGPEWGAYVHYGATTQDITDTGLALQLHRAVDLVEERLRELMRVLAGLAERHRDLPMVGRTHAQHALPITLGFKFAVLLAECERHAARLTDARPRALVGQLGGAVGSMAAFGAAGPRLHERMMERLGLGSAPIAWHTARDGLTELVCVAAMTAATCGKIANEVRVLQRTEVAELEEPFATGKVGSSTMPHKRNPMYCEYIISSAILCRQAPAQMLAAMHQEHERDMSLWGVEWAAVPETFCLTAGLLERTAWILDGLVVHPDALHTNLHRLGDLMLSEAAMMHLARTLGKTAAHDVVYEASMHAWETGRPLRESLAENTEIADAGVDLGQLGDLLVPETYLGSCGELVDRVVEQAHAFLADADADADVDASAGAGGGTGEGADAVPAGGRS